MKASKKSSSMVLVPATLLVLASSPFQLFAGDRPAAAKWDLQVDTVESGDVNIGLDFKVAIYENLLNDELEARARISGRRVVPPRFSAPR